LRFLRALAAAGALVASACSDDIAIVEDQSTGQFSPEEYARDAAQGDIPVAVLGNAYGASGERLARLVLNHMQDADWAPHARLTAIGEPTGSRIYSYVMMFNGPPEVTSAALCARTAHLPPTPAGAPDGNSIRIVAGLCRNDTVAAGVTARAANVGGIGDGKFHTLIVRIVQTLTRPDRARIDR
jgi:hypothetical protein